VDDAESGLRPEAERLLDHPPPSDRRIAVLGDSIAYGWGLPYGASYPVLIGEWLSGASALRERWYVLNAGVPGDTVLQGAARYDRHVRPFRPAILLLAFGLNDGALRRTRYDAQREQLWLAQRCAWVRGQAILRRLARAGQQGDASKEEDVVHEALPRVRERLFARAFGGLVAKARRDGAVVHLVRLTPVVERLLPAAQAQAYRVYDALIAQVAAKAGVACVRMENHQADPFDPETMSWPDGIHLTAAGQSWVARRVYRHLVGAGGPGEGAQ